MKYLIYCNSTNNETVTHTYEGYNIGLTDAENRVINAEINVTSVGVFNSTNNILGIISNYSGLSGTGIEGIATVVFRSTTGEQTPSFMISYDGTMSNIYNRYLSSDNDVGTVRFYSHYNSTNTTNFTLSANIAAGETLRLGSSLILIDSTNLNQTLINLNPIVVIEYPPNGSTQWYDNQDLNIMYNLNIDEKLFVMCHNCYFHHLHMLKKLLNQIT